MRYSRQRNAVHTTESCKAYLDSFVGTENLFLSVQLLRGEKIGTMTVYFQSSTLADVGILIGIPGCGYGKESWGLCLAYLFECKKVQRVSAGTVENNQAMVKVFEFWGMRETERVVDTELGAVLRRYVVDSSSWMSGNGSSAYQFLIAG